jgi:hypothetical protein
MPVRCGGVDGVPEGCGGAMKGHGMKRILWTLVSGAVALPWRCGAAVVAA